MSKVGEVLTPDEANTLLRRLAAAAVKVLFLIAGACGDNSAPAPDAPDSCRDVVCRVAAVCEDLATGATHPVDVAVPLCTYAPDDSLAGVEAIDALHEPSGACPYQGIRSYTVSCLGESSAGR